MKGAVGGEREAPTTFGEFQVAGSEKRNGKATRLVSAGRAGCSGVRFCTLLGTGARNRARRKIDQGGGLRKWFLRAWLALGYSYGDTSFARIDQLDRLEVRVVDQLGIGSQDSLCCPQYFSLQAVFGHSFASKNADKAQCCRFRCY